MHWLDITILITLAVGAGMGFWTGLLWQVARVVSLVLSAYLAIQINAEVAGWIAGQWPDSGPAVQRIAAFLGVFLFVYIILYLLTRLAHQAIKASNLETWDRVLGALLGAAKMTAVAACICAVLASLALPIFQEWFDKATIAPALAKGTKAVVGWVPQSYHDRIDDGVTQVRQQMREKIADAAADVVRAEPAKK
jgi:uncharacterized membrane protein required for colicin V production